MLRLKYSRDFPRNVPNGCRTFAAHLLKSRVGRCAAEMTALPVESSSLKELRFYNARVERGTMSGVRATNEDHILFAHILILIFRICFCRPGFRRLVCEGYRDGDWVQSPTSCRSEYQYIPETCTTGCAGPELKALVLSSFKCAVPIEMRDDKVCSYIPEFCTLAVLDFLHILGLLRLLQPL